MSRRGAARATGWLGVLVGGALLGCGSPPTDAERYTHALSDAGSYADSARSCAGIGHETTRFDCTLAVLERWNRLEDADCEAIDDARLQDECRFQLAERRFRAGDLDGAIATCEATRFRRPCSWHLVRDTAEASVDLPMAQAEADVKRFANASAIPDAGKQYWMVYARTRIGRRQVVDEAECETLQEPESCRDAFFHLVLDLLRETAGTRIEQMCHTPFGQRIVLGGQPVWKAGPIVRRAEGLWEERHCTPQHPPKGVPPPEPPPKPGSPAPPSP